MPNDLFAAATAAFNSGALAEAEGHLLRLLRNDPRHVSALNLLGIVATRMGRYPQAVAAIERALAIEPNNPSLHCNLGECYRCGGRPDEAEPHYRRALMLRPDYATAYYDLGLAQAAQDKLEEAADSYRSALRAKPDYPKALTNLGNLLKRQGKPEQALSCHRRSIELSGSHPDALYNLANTLRTLDRVDEAESLYRQVLQQVPAHCGALNNLGTCLGERGLLDQALACHEASLRAHPNDWNALINLAIVLKGLNRLQAANRCLEKLIALRPTDPQILCSIADLLHELDRDNQAVAIWEQVLAADPQCLRAHDGLGSHYKARGDMVRARAHFEARLVAEPDNLVLRLRTDVLCPAISEDVECIDALRTGITARLDAHLRHSDWHLDPQDVVRYGCEPSFNLPFHGRDDLHIKRRHAGLLARYLPAELPLERRTGIPHIALVVTAGHEGIFLRSVVSNINRFSQGRVRMTIVCPAGSIDGIRTEVTHPDVTYLPLARRLAQIRRDLRAAQIDLLYYHEVGSDSLNYILPFFRLAPVQCTTWGIQVTSGIPNLDVYLSSRWTEPEGAQAHYSERLILQDTLLKQRTPARITREKTRADFDLSDQHSIYFCPQHLGKLHPEFDPLIGAILRKDRTGVVLLVEHPSAEDARRLMQRLGRSLADVLDRIRVLPHQDQQDYCNLIVLSDVLLDPLHFSGVNTTYDALALGKAVVTLPGAFQRGRYTFGCYRKLGVMDCVAESVEDYVAIAVRLATDEDYRRDVEARIQNAAPKLFEPDRIAAELEDCLLGLIAESRGPGPA